MVAISVLAEDNAQHDEEVKLQGMTLEGKSIPCGEIHIELRKDHFVRIEALSEAVNPEWQAELSIDVTRAPTRSSQEKEANNG